MNINLHIERLVLDGVALDPLHQSQLKASLAAELERLLTLNGLPASLQNGGEILRVPADSITILENNDAYHLSGQIVQSVYGGIQR